MHRSLFRLFTVALTLLLVSPAEAQFTRDAAANKKIDEAINTHYLATDFAKAEGVLTGTVKACEDKCSPQTLARAWMYVGIVRGSGKNDIAGAKEAFQTAMALDANVKLDAALATPETQAAFAETGGGGAVETPATPATPEAPPAAAAPSGEGLSCTPEVTQVETRRNIPVECTSDEEVTNVELRYRAFGSETWKTLKMDKKGKGFRAQIPCEVTQSPGTLRVYVRAKDASGDEVANWGSKNAPIEFQLVEESQEDAPSYSDADPPERCAAKEICPPDFPGCETKKSGGTLDWGASCGNSAECKAGLLCLEGVCETAPSCKTDSDCPAGTCIDGKCGVEGSSGGAATGPHKKIWIGLHVAQDIAFVSGSQVCEDERQTSEAFACYVPGGNETPYSSDYFTRSGIEDDPSFGDIATGTVAATTRFLLSLDYAFTPKITAGVRLGYAIRGGPPAGKEVDYDDTDPQGETFTEVTNPGTKFLPFHAEARVGYWFTGLSAKIRPYAVLGGGMAQVDARVVARVRDDLGTADIEAWKKLGQGFVTLAGGAQLALSSRLALQANVNFMYMLSASGLVIQPSLGVAYGL